MSIGQDRQLLDLLNQATNHQLHTLQATIERLLADPRRIVEVRRHLHLGQSVRFLDWQRGQMLKGQVIAMSDRQVELKELGAPRQWKLPYTAVEIIEGSAAVAEPQAPPPVQPPRPTRNDFRCGDKVSFEDRYLQTQVGVIIRINQRTATVDTGDGGSWRVGFGLLRPVVDV
jgi:hypothetical protein